MAVQGPLWISQEHWTYKRFIREVLVDQDNIISWCKQIGILARRQECTRCNKDMLWEKYTAGIDGYRYNITVH